MGLNAAFLGIVAAGAFLLVTACGGGVDSGTSQPQPGTVGDSGQLQVGSGTSSGGSGATNGTTNGGGESAAAPTPGSVIGSWSTRRCSPLPQTITVAGGTLFVAEQGPVGITLLSDGGMSVFLNFLYDYVFGIPDVSNPQDKYAYAWTLPFTVGASTQVQLQPPPRDFIPDGQTLPGTFPKGIPIELWSSIGGMLPNEANSSGTASIFKDITHYPNPTARVTYGPNDTATVTLFPTTDGTGITVGLTNVCGSGLQQPVYVPAARALALDPTNGQIDVFVGAAGSGFQLDPVTRKLGAAFSGLAEPRRSGSTSTEPDAQGRTFTLTPTTTPTVWTLSSSTGNSITISDLVGGADPSSLIRYGTRGLAFRGGYSLDVIYLVESLALIP